MKVEIEIPDELLRDSSGCRYEPTGEFRVPVGDEFWLSNGQVWGNIRDRPSNSSRIILRKLPPPEKKLRPFKSADEVPGHFVWLRYTKIESRIGKRFMISCVCPLGFDVGPKRKTLPILFSDALDLCELAGPDLQWQPAGILE